MYKLNESGFGLSTFFLFICIFLVAIIVISIQSYKLGLTSNSSNNVPITNSVIDKKKPVTNVSKEEYKIKENSLIPFAKKYQEVYYPNMLVGDKVIVTIKKLVSLQYLNNLMVNNDKCSGYVSIQNINNEIHYIPYINCNTYKSVGYNSSLDDLS